MDQQLSTVLAVFRVSSDTVCLRLRSAHDYLPGQFVTIAAHVPAAGKRVLRSYSVSSAHNGEWLEVTVKAQQPGLLSQHVQTWSGGETVEMQGPYGHFTLDFAQQSRPLVFIAGGSGIAPFRCMLQEAVKRSFRGAVRVLYSVKTSADILYAEELRALCQTLGAQLVVTLSRPSQSDLAQWSGAFGRITGKLLRDTLGEDFTGFDYYICGPTPMVKDVEALLASHGVQKERVKTEKYGQIEG